MPDTAPADTEAGVNKMLMDVVITAIEHMGYGCIEADITVEAPEPPPGTEDPTFNDGRGVPFSVRVARAIIHPDGGVVLRDRYGEGYQSTTVDRERLLWGCATRGTWLMTRGKHTDGVRHEVALEHLHDVHDVVEADCALQYAAFGEVVFG